MRRPCQRQKSDATRPGARAAALPRHRCRPTDTLRGGYVAEGPGGTLLASAGDGKPAGSAPVRNDLARAFGDRLAEAREAMGALAANLPPDELSRVGFCLYEHFRPEMLKGVKGWGEKGWGAKGEHRLDRIRDAGA
jgi:hypothetical protein